MLTPQQVQTLQASKGNPGGTSTGGFNAPQNQPMNDEQFKSWLGGGSSAPSDTNSNMASPLKTVEESQANGANSIVNTVGNISNDINSNFKMADNISRDDSGNVNPLKAVGAAGLAGAKSTVDTLGEAATGAGDALVKMISPFIPQKVKDVYGTETQKALSDIKSAWNAPATTPEEQAGKDKVHGIMDALVKVVQNNPETSKTIGDAISMVLAPSAIEGGMSMAKDAVSGVKNIAVDATNAVMNRNAPSVLSYIDSNGQKVFTRVSSDEYKLLSNEVKNIPQGNPGGAQQIHLDAITDKSYTGAKEVSRGDFIQGHPQAQEMFNNINPKGPVQESDSLVKESGQVTPKQAQQSAWKDIQPKTTPTTKLAYAKTGNTTPQTLLTPGKLTPSTADAKLLDSYTKLYEDGTVKDSMNPNEKQIAVKQKAAQLHAQQKDFLATHDKAVTLSSRDKSGLFDQLDTTAKKSSMPFSKDPTTKGAYDSVIDTFKGLLDTGKSAGTVKGASSLSKIDQALTSLDSEMEKYGAWGKAKTGEITDTAMARQQAIRDIHTQVRDYISGQLPKNSPWKAIRMEESNMYQISDRLAQRVSETIGTSKVGQVIKDNPIIKTGIQAAGMGAGIHLIP